MKKPKTTIAKKMIIWIVCSNVVVSFIITLVYLIGEYQKNIDKIITNISDIVNITRPSLGDSLYKEDEVQIEKIVKGLLKKENIVQVRIEDPESKELLISMIGDGYKKKTPADLKKLIIAKTFTITKLDGDSIENLGDLTIMASKEEAIK